MGDEIIIVTGLPRSGTSMMMRMLKEGGIPILSDNMRTADENNPYGYYEFEKVKEIDQDISWLKDAKGKAVKIVTMLLFKLPPYNDYSIIFMKRKIDEIVKSQRVMLERMGKIPKYKDEELKVLYSKHLNEVESWLSKQKNWKVLYLSYNEAIENPTKIVLKIKDFLKKDLNINKMIECVDSSLYRQRVVDDSVVKESASLSEDETEKIKEQLKSLGYL